MRGILRAGSSGVDRSLGMGEASGSIPDRSILFSEISFLNIAVTISGICSKHTDLPGRFNINMEKIELIAKRYEKFSPVLIRNHTL